MASHAARLGWLLALVGWAGSARAQHAPPQAPPLPAPAQAVPAQAAPAQAPTSPPLLYVKLIGPKGMQVHFFRGPAPAQSYDVPCIIGIRPGYSVRLAITGVPDHPGEAFFPTLDVHGSLILHGKSRPADFPAALVFRADDFARVKADATLKKVVVLERPDTAVPVATTPDEPFEVDVPASGDPLREARERGQPLLVLHLGERQLTRAELVTPPGVLLLPGDSVLPTPSCPPWLAWQCLPVDLCIPDGGDVGLPAGFDRLGKLRGLDPSDTVAEYVDSRGRQRLAISNRVCLCIPRYVIVKTEIALANRVALYGPGALKSANGYARMERVQLTAAETQRMQPERIGANQRASANLQVVGTAISGRIENLIVVGTVHAVKAFEAARLLGPEAEEGPLLIIKWPDHCDALVGDIVTFTLKYTNTGGRPITNVVVSDSLTNRLQYVPGSAKSDREAIFTTQPNEVGSSILRWQITGSLRPRESGLVTFQVRVR
jgi:uncharacterized repeat protein (TIGR01451 family)